MKRTLWLSVALAVTAGCQPAPTPPASEQPAPSVENAATPSAEATKPQATPGEPSAVKPATAAEPALKTQQAGTIDPFSDAPLAGKPPEAFVFPQPPLVMPPVLLSTAEAQTCKVVVGDNFPDLSLAKLSDNAAAQPLKLPLARATVVLFWTPGNPYAQQALEDVDDLLGARQDDLQVQVMGICVAPQADAAKALLAEHSVQFPNYLDAQGVEYAKVATTPPPRIYLLDESGKILWFDLEFSRATRRELIQAIRFLQHQRKSG